jgi:hypothetical protein
MSEDRVPRLEALVRLQMEEIDRLRAENKRLLDWIMGDEPDALTKLQAIYSDPNTPRSEQIKSSGLALPFERSKPASVVIQGNFNARLRTIRLAQLPKDIARAAEDAAKLIEAKPLDLEGPTPPTILGGDDSAGLRPQGGHPS